MGILNLIRSAFTNGEKEPHYDTIINAGYAEMKAKGDQYWWSVKPNELKSFTNKLLPLSDKEKAAFITMATYKISTYLKGKNSFSSEDKQYKLYNLATAFMQHLLKTKLLLGDEDIEAIVEAFFSYSISEYNTHILYWPVNTLVNQIEKNIKERGVSGKLTNTLQRLRTRVNERAHAHQEKDQAKIIAKIDAILFNSNEHNTGVKPTFFPGDDAFGNYANETINALDETGRQNWFKLMLHAQKASGAKPSKKYSDEVKLLFKEFGVDKFKQQVNEWFLFLIAMKEKTEQHVQGTYNNTTTEFLTPPNVDIIKGFIWSCVHFHDKTTVFNIAQLANRAYRKIPGKGPTAAAIGNACLYVLANSKGLDGIGHLSRLKLRIKQTSTQNQIEKYLQEAAAAQGVSIHEIEDMAVDDYGLLNAKRAYDFDGCKAILEWKTKFYFRTRGGVYL